MDYGLRGTVAVVMAASRGLGRASAQLLAAEGCDLAISSRSLGSITRAAEEIRASTQRAVLPCAVDVRRPEDITAFAQAVQARYGRVDILVNNGGGPPPGSFDALDDTSFIAACELLLLNTVRTTKAFLPLLRQSLQGRIITLTSTSTREVVANLMLSNSLRAAVAGWSKTLARELAPTGITVNCIAPGTIGTERIEELIAANAAKSAVSHEEATAQLRARIPMGRFGTPEEFAAGVAFLASRGASFISGINLVVDGAATLQVQ
jgi:3-oxoacyl-[acyl-carrier protein] reductase